MPARRRLTVAAPIAAFAFLIAAAAPGEAADPWPAGNAAAAVTVTKPADQTGAVGTAVTPVQIKADVADTSRMVVYSASGLPAGLSISTVIGAISGTPTKVGTFEVTITATAGSAKGTTTFRWTIGKRSAVAPPEDGAGFHIRLSGTKNVVDNPGSSTVEGKQLIIYSAHDGANLVWRATRNDDGTYSFRNEASGLCLSVAETKTVFGVPVVQETCADGAGQDWRLVESETGFILVNASNNQGLGSASAVRRARLFTRDSDAVWVFEPAADAG